jgi:hypothetical protein
MALIDQNLTYNTSRGLAAPFVPAVGQSFTGAGTYLVYALFKINKVGSPTGSAYAKLYAHSGTYGSTSVPTGSPLAVSNAVDVSTINISFDTLFTFPAPYLLANGTYYVITLEYNGGDVNNYLSVYFNNSSVHGGNYSELAGSWTYTSTYDLYFRVYAEGGSYYLCDDTLSSALYFLDFVPRATLDEAQGWTVDKKASPNYAFLWPNFVRPYGDFSSTEPTSFSQYGYRSRFTLKGSFANANWVLSFKVKSNTYYAQTGYVKLRLWRSVNANGSGATQITPGWQSSSLIAFTAANQYQTGTITWSPGAAVTLTNEYLFLEIEWSCSASGGNNSAAVYWAHNEGTAEKLEAPAFTPVISGTVAGNLAPVTGSESGNVKITGTGAATLAAVTGAHSGKVKITGTQAGQLAAVVAALSGGVKLTGSLAANLEALTAALAGLVGEGRITGTVAATLAALTAAGSGNVKISGTQAATLTPVSAGLTGALKINGSLTATLAVLTSILTGNVKIGGTQAATLASASAGLTGNVKISGSLAPGLAPLTGNLAGALKISGSLAAILAQASAGLTGNVKISGSLASTLAALTSTLTGNVNISGTMAASLAALFAYLEEAGYPQITGEVLATMAALTAAAGGDVKIGGGMQANLTPLIASETGEVDIAAVLAALLEQLGGDLSGSVQIGGSLAAVLAQVIAELIEAAPEQILGLIAANLPPLTGGLAGQVEIAGNIIALLAVLTAAAAGKTDISGEITAVTAQLLAAWPAAVNIEGILQADCDPLTALLCTRRRITRGQYLGLVLNAGELTLNLD